MEPCPVPLPTATTSTRDFSTSRRPRSRASCSVVTIFRTRAARFPRVIARRAPAPPSMCTTEATTPWETRRPTSPIGTPRRATSASISGAIFWDRFPSPLRSARRSTPSPLTSAATGRLGPSVRMDRPSPPTASRAGSTFLMRRSSLMHPPSSAKRSAGSVAKRCSISTRRTPRGSSSTKRKFTKISSITRASCGRQSRPAISAPTPVCLRIGSGWWPASATSAPTTRARVR